MVINMPILKDHRMAGVTFAMKNMYGVVDRPSTLHANNCNPGVADLNCIPVIRSQGALHHRRRHVVGVRGRARASIPSGSGIPTR